jgi:hypothetical protein
LGSSHCALLSDALVDLLVDVLFDRVSEIVEGIANRLINVFRPRREPSAMPSMAQVRHLA